VRDALQAKGIADIECRTGRSGQFDIVIDGKVAYSKYETGRFPSETEIDRLLTPD
jgi:selT/selW/selH-like putative selenoprotein